ncbi:MAG TPA: OmpA family protein [Alphaproteobacteria bacterium]|jgi:outer membrane protein OmpA-like peptidoglycan-associated protein
MLAVFAAGVALSSLGACSSVPDAVNPVEWYRGAASVFEDDEQQQERAAEAAARETTQLPGAGQDYPNLSTVPNRPNPTPSAERGKVAQGLAADRENARYAESDPQRAAPPPAPGLNPVAAPAGRVSSTPLAAPAPAPVPAPQAAAAASTPAPQPQAAAPQPAPAQPASSSAVALPPPVYQSVPAPTPQPPARQAAAPAPAGPVGMTQTATVYFTNNSATVDADDRRALNTLAQSYKDTGGSLRIVGFASSGRATAAAQIANFRIASQRAEAVAQELARLGVPRTRMTVSSATAAGGGDPALERRVEIALDY